MKLRFALAAVALVATGCASTPFSYIDGNKYTQVDINTYSVVILSVNGSSYTDNPVMVTKFGPTTVTVQVPPPGIFGATTGWASGDTQTITIDVKPCVRYYLKAVKKNPLEVSFTASVDYEQPISPCKTA